MSIRAGSKPASPILPNGDDKHDLASLRRGFSFSVAHALHKLAEQFGVATGTINKRPPKGSRSANLHDETGTSDVTIEERRPAQ